MAIIKCKMCGGDIELSADKTYGTCDSCGSTMTFPKVDDEHRANLFNRANHFRRQNEFDKAISAYERILDEDNTDAEAHWGVVLSRFGIEYVEDPVSHERIPTCHRVQAVSILTDADYLAACEYAPDGYSRSLYEAEAKRIADIQKGILAISSQEKPYDVFICYKESTEGGSRTKDSTIAQDIYYQLKQEGFNVFFARITLEDKLGQQYEPYIFAALNSAKVMLVVGTKPEYFNAVWVKNEWSRYLALMKQDRSRLLIPCYRDMDAYDLPDELSTLQSQDMSKIGFMQDLIRGVAKVLGNTAQDKPVEGTSAQAPGVASLLKRAKLFLEDGDVKSADEYAEKVLDIDPECSDAYLVKTLIAHNWNNEDQLRASRVSLEADANFSKAMRFANAQQKEMLNDMLQSIQDNIRTEELYKAYQNAVQLYRQSRTERDFLQAKAAFDALGAYQNATQMAESCQEKVDELRRKAEAQQREAEERLRAQKLREQKEAAERAARQEQRELERKRLAEQERLRQEAARRRNKKLLSILAILTVVAVAVGLFVVKAVIPQLKYSKADTLLAEGKYDEAIAGFTEVADWKDSKSKLHSAYYAKAEKLLQKGDYSTALTLYQQAGNYKDTKTKIERIKLYSSAVQGMKKDTKQARHTFAELGDFLDSKSYHLACCEADYETAVSYLNSNSGGLAHALFVDLGDYSNSAEQAAAIEAEYAKAETLLADGKRDDAISIYTRLGTYADSEQKKHAALLAIAEELLAEGKYDEAIEQFTALNEKTRVQTAKQAKHDYLCAQAETLLAESKYDEAIELFTELHETKRVQAAKQAKHNYLCAQAETLLTEGKYDEAIERFTVLGKTDRVQAAKDAQNAERLRLADEALAEHDYATAFEHYMLVPQTEDVKAKEYTYAQSAHDAGYFEYAVRMYEILGKYELSVSRLPVARYALANQYYVNKQYEEAAKEFALLEDYSDSATRAKDSTYQYGKQLLEAASYDAAKSVFSSLGNYNDAPTMCKECDYRKATALMAQGDYIPAFELFGQISNYADSKTQRNKCNYLLAEQDYANGDYSKARSRYAIIKTYKDANEKYQICTYRVASEKFEAGLYDDAKTLYRELGDYENSRTMISECYMQNALRYQSEGAYSKALYELSYVNHTDTARTSAECNAALGDEAYKKGNTAEAIRYYALATVQPETREKLYTIGKDYASTNQMDKAIETLWLAGDYEPARKYLLEIGQVLNSNGQTVLACISYIAANENVDTHCTKLMETKSPANIITVVQQVASLTNSTDFHGAILYPYAMALKKAEKYDDAITVFAFIKGYADSDDQVLDSKYDAAVTLINQEKYSAAYDIFITLGKHKDSALMAASIYSKAIQEKIATAVVGRFISFGTYEQDNNATNGKEPIEWLVLDKNDNEVLLISRYALDAQAYHATTESSSRLDPTLYTWLQNDFYHAAFNDEERAMRPDIILLGRWDIEKYLTSDRKRVCEPTAYAKARGVETFGDIGCRWWLASGHADTPDAVDTDGSSNICLSSAQATTVGVRPAMRIKLN